MKMPSVHHEISMKIPWVTFPKSDFGFTVLIGVSQFQPTALQAEARRRTAPSRQSRVQSRRFTMPAIIIEVPLARSRHRLGRRAGRGHGGPVDVDYGDPATGGQEEHEEHRD